MNKHTYIAVLIISVVLPITSQAFDQSSPANSLVVDTNGNIGVGTELPTESLHVLRDDGNSSVLIEEKGTNDSTATKARTLLRMINNGGPNFSFQDSSTSEGWQFAMTTAGDMAISKELTGGSEFIVQKSGRVRMGPGPITNFDLRDNGNLLIPNGSVTANGILLTSSRATKTDISAINPAVVMQKLKKMELAEWRYKKADKNDRHISPMAEDFYSLFNLGPSNKHINPNDLASVALIAAKELQKKDTIFKQQLNLKTSDLKTENSKLKKQIEAQNKRLVALEKLVMNLASGQNTLPTKGEQVVLNK